MTRGHYLLRAAPLSHLDLQGSIFAIFWHFIQASISHNKFRQVTRIFSICSRPELGQHSRKGCKPNVCSSQPPSCRFSSSSCSYDGRSSGGGCPHLMLYCGDSGLSLSKCKMMWGRCSLDHCKLPEFLSLPNRKDHPPFRSLRHQKLCNRLVDTQWRPELSRRGML